MKIIHTSLLAIVLLFSLATGVMSGLVLVGGGSAVPSLSILLGESACPTGLTEVTALRGMYVVGTPSGGTVGATVGTALTNTENRASGQHTHQLDISSTTGSSNVATRGSGVTPSSGTTSTAGAVAGTNLPYTQIIFCEKP